MLPPWLTATLAIIGAVAGLSGLCVSILNYRRDRSQVILNVLFNLGSPGQKVTTFSVLNAGRRKAFTSGLSLCRTRFWRLGTVRKGPMYIVPSSGTVEEGSEGFRHVIRHHEEEFQALVGAAASGYLRACAIVNGSFTTSRAFKLPLNVEP